MLVSAGKNMYRMVVRMAETADAAVILYSWLTTD